MLFAFIAGLSTSASILLIVCLLAVCFFEAINGFHDTANAVATVIYTKTLKPTVAVVLSGIMNFIGVLFGGAFVAWLGGLFGSGSSGSGIDVAMGILKLMPVNQILGGDTTSTIAMVLGVLLSAIVWNLGTWYYGIPCSSSHTLIGALLGAGFGYSMTHAGSTVNWGKASEIGLSLLLSPMFGFFLAVALMYLLVTFVKNKVIFKEPDPQKAPPTWIRAILILTCTLVSFFHGSNDGQKGVGLLLVVMMAFMPIHFAVNQAIPTSEYKVAVGKMQSLLTQASEGNREAEHLTALSNQALRLTNTLDSVDMKDRKQVVALRKDMQSLNKAVDADIKSGIIPAASVKALKHEISALKHGYEFAPLWAVILISICLGIGTMIGWKRIVVTIGEKIGKSHLTYAQGASAEICAAATIGLSTGYGLPVSTTHVLSSGIAGTMVASGGVKNLQRKTIANIALAWLLTLPVTFALGFGLYFLLDMFI